MDDKQVVERLERIEQAEKPFQKYILQLITLIFLAGGGWVTLNSVQALAEENKASIEVEKQKTQEIDKKLVRIETTQTEMKKQLEEAAKIAKENQRMLDKILNKLEDN